MPVASSRRSHCRSGLLLTGLCLAAAAEPIIPGVPTPLDDALNPGATASASASATPSHLGDRHAHSATASASSSTPTPTATATATPTGTATPTPTPTGGTLDSDGLFTPAAQPDASSSRTLRATPPPTRSPELLGDPDDDLDIIGVVYKTTSTALQVFVTETKLDEFPTSMGGFIYDTHSFSTGFTHRRQGDRADSRQATGPATATVGGAASTALKPTATFDIGRSNIVFSVPRAELATLIGKDVPGSELTALSASSARGELASACPASTRTPRRPPRRRPPPRRPTWSVTTPASARRRACSPSAARSRAPYTDLTTLTATLKDAEGKAVAGAPIKLQMAGSPALTKTTNSSGQATFVFAGTGSGRHEGRQRGLRRQPDRRRGGVDGLLRGARREHPDQGRQQPGCGHGHPDRQRAPAAREPDAGVHGGQEGDPAPHQRQRALPS